MPLRSLLLTAPFVAGACACSAAPRSTEPDATPRAAEAPGPARFDAAPPPPIFPAGTRSLRLKKSATLRAAPDAAAKPIGVAAGDMRLLWRGDAEGPGCEGRWIELEPRGWVCERALEPSRRAPTDVRFPRVAEGRLVPGIYGKVTGKDVPVFASEADAEANRPARVLEGSVRIRRDEKVTIAGKEYWRSTRGDLIPSEDIGKERPSSFAGVRLGAEGAPRLPFAWAQSRDKQRQPVIVRGGPASSAVRTLARRTIIPVLGASADGRLIQIAEGEWVAAADLHVARATEPPPGVAEGERWIDVDLDEQVLVAWEGRTAVYATLVSSGLSKHPTPPGVFRIWGKYGETDMTGEQTEEEDPYSVALVPWTMYYARDFALHTSYWHDGFGNPRSHGCVNLSPADARFLYEWTVPDVPAGWTMARATVEMPGTTVRVRSREAPEPELQGYARKVWQARSGGAAPAAPDDEPGPDPAASEPTAVEAPTAPAVAVPAVPAMPAVPAP